MKHSLGGRNTAIRCMLLDIVPLLLLVLFAYTGTAKLLGHKLFLFHLRKIHLPAGLTVFASYAIPLAELVIALLICFKVSRWAGLWLSSVAMLSFTIYVAVVLAGKDQPCSCGGVLEAMNWTAHLYFNIGFLLLSVLSLYGHKLFTRVQGVS